MQDALALPRRMDWLWLGPVYSKGCFRSMIARVAGNCLVRCCCGSVSGANGKAESTIAFPLYLGHGPFELGRDDG